MYKKYGRSIAQLPNTEVHITGSAATGEAAEEVNIKLHPLFLSKASLRARLQQFSKYYHLLVKVRPSTILCTSPDLLLVSVWYKIIYGCVLYYDVRENYWLNTLYMGGHNGPGKYVKAMLVRGLEWFCSSTIDRFFLAERVYEQQLPYIGKRYSIIENWHDGRISSPKSVPMPPFTIDRPLRLAVTGTIAKNYGVLEAIYLAKVLNANNISTELTVAGFCRDIRLYENITNNNTKWLNANLVSNAKAENSDLLNKILNANDILVMLYPNNKAIIGKVPTKVYECIVAGKPFIMNEEYLGAMIKLNPKLSDCLLVSNLSNCFSTNDAKFSKLVLCQILANQSIAKWDANFSKDCLAWFR